MNLKTLLKIFSDKDCNKVYVKKLSANDNSKNQVYFGGSFDVLNILPIKEITSDADNKGGGKKTRFKTKLDFYWAADDGQLSHAPDAQLVLYPKYPEVRFSGFLKGSKNAPSDLMAERIPDRLLFLGVSKARQVIGYVVGPESSLVNEFSALQNLEDIGVFKSITLLGDKIETDSRGKLLQELKRINNLGWIDARRLSANNKVSPCNSTNCGGYTMEAELGIVENSNSLPDYLGWELKTFSVNNFSKFGSKAVTLMTPEPTDGLYVDEGLEKFITTYGYKDKMGREARMNFGGIHKFAATQKSTGLKLVLEGYDAVKDKIEDTDGYLGLIDDKETIAASWSFAALLEHWNRKHAQACYIPSMKRKTADEVYKQQYSYGNLVIMGEKTDFSIFLKQVALGNVYYDPGIKLELAIPGVRDQGTKRRSQFRMKASQLTNLYKENEVVNLLCV